MRPSWGQSECLQKKQKRSKSLLCMKACSGNYRLLSQPQLHKCHNHHHYLSQLCVCRPKRCKEVNTASSLCWSQGWTHSGYFRHLTQQWPLCFQECDLSHTDTNPHMSYEPCIYVPSTGIRVTVITYSEMVENDHSSSLLAYAKSTFTITKLGLGKVSEH